MKIAIVSDAFYPTNGGIANASRSLAEALATHGMDVHVFTPVPGRSRLQPNILLDEVKVHRIRVYGGVIKKLAKGRLVPVTMAVASILAHHVVKVKPDIVLGQLIYWGGSVAALAKKLRKLTAFAYGHGEDVNQLVGNESKIWLTRFAVNNIDLTLTTNSDFAKILSGFTSREIRLLPNLLPHVHINDIFDSKYGKPFKLLAIGRFSRSVAGEEIKGFSTALRAMVHLDGCELNILGDGELKDEYRNFISREKLGNRVFLRGQLPRSGVYEFLESSHALLLPSNIEGLSMVMLEAMQYGLPVLATMVGGAKDYVKNDYNGFLIEKGDFEALTESVKKIASDSNLYVRLARNSRATYLDNFTPDKVATRFYQIASEMVASR